jgi:hypothetical protein
VSWDCCIWPCGRERAACLPTQLPCFPPCLPACRAYIPACLPIVHAHLIVLLLLLVLPPAGHLRVV